MSLVHISAWSFTARMGGPGSISFVVIAIVSCSRVEFAFEANGWQWRNSNWISWPHIIASTSKILLPWSSNGVSCCPHELTAAIECIWSEAKQMQFSSTQLQFFALFVHFLLNQIENNHDYNELCHIPRIYTSFHCNRV